MRLIDADSFKSFLQALVKAGAPYDDVITLLDKEKTAYYPEKTIAEIKKKSRKMSTIKIPHKYYRAIGTRVCESIIRRGGSD
jgi:hypothetical protein